MNYYGQYSQTNTGFVDQIAQWCREWLTAAQHVNRQSMAQWMETKGAAQIATRLASVNPNPQINFAKQFVYNELNGIAPNFPINTGFQQQQPSFQTNPGMSTYGGTSQPAIQPEPPKQENVMVDEPEIEYTTPTKESEKECVVPGASGSMTLYINDDESRFSHLKLKANIAFANDRDLIDYLSDVKLPGRAVIQVSHMKLKRFKIPAMQFKDVVSSISKMVANKALMKSMTDVELFEAYNDCLANIPAGMVNKVTSIVLELVNQFTRSKFLQHSSNVRSTIMLSQPKDIYALLTNDSSLEKFKEVHGYNGRIRAIMELVLETISKVHIDDGSEFGEESPWLTMCGNLALEDGSGLVKSAYLSPDRNVIKVQKELAEKYTVVGIPTTTFVVFDTPKNESSFVSIKNPKGCKLVESPRDDIEFIICSESGGLLLSEVVLMDSIYPYPQHFTHGETIDHVSVITKW